MRERVREREGGGERETGGTAKKHAAELPACGGTTVRNRCSPETSYGVCRNHCWVTTYSSILYNTGF